MSDDWLDQWKAERAAKLRAMVEFADEDEFATFTVAEGFLIADRRPLPDATERCVGIRLLVLGRAEIVTFDKSGIWQGWSYDTVGEAVAAYVTWDGAATIPDGWRREFPSHRRRPAGGTVADTYINAEDVPHLTDDATLLPAHEPDTMLPEVTS